MSEILSYLEIWQAWQWLPVAGLTAIAIALVLINHRLRKHNRRLTDAMNHMPQGLCMYDGAERLVLFNKPYVSMASRPTL